MGRSDRRRSDLAAGDPVRTLDTGHAVTTENFTGKTVGRGARERPPAPVI